MKSLLQAVLLTVLAAGAAPVTHAQTAPAGEPLDGIVAIVDEDVVLQSELDHDVAAVTQQFAKNPQQLPPRDVLERQVLDRLINQKVQIARADSTGVKVADAEVDQAMQRIAAQNKLDVSQLREALQGQGLDYDQFRKNVRNQLLIQRLRQRVAQSRAQVSDAEIDSLIKNGRVQSGQLHLGYIVIGVPDGATPEQIDTAKVKADEAEKQIADGMDFAAAAIRYSSAENALQGGDLGWRGRQELPPALVDVADKLQEGQVSPPIRGPNGFNVVKLIGKREQGAQVVTEVHARHILIKTSELVSSDQAQKKLAAIRQKIVGGEDFAKAAQESSDDDATARLGGDLGWFSGDAYGTRVAQELTTLKPNDISQPFQTDAGWHIVQLLDTRNTDKSSQLQREQAKDILFQRKAEEEYDAFLRQIRSEAYVDIRLSGGNAPKPPIEPAATPANGS